MDEFQSTSKYVTPPTRNVGPKISTWLTDFVDEASRKSFSTLRKWIHSSATIDRQANNEHTDEFSQGNTIYRNMDSLDNNVLSHTEDSETENTTNSNNHSTCTNVTKIYTKKCIEGNNTSHVPSENELNISEDEIHNFENFERPIKLGLLGRASTIQDVYTLKPLNILRQNKCKNTFVPICRSYSEQQDDEINKEYDNNYKINKRSQSLTQVNGKKMDLDCQRDTIDCNKSNSNKRNKVSSNSLPSFFDQSSGIHNSTPKTDSELLSYKRDKFKNFILRDNSYHSDSSHCSSVDSLLDSRKPDPEAILINLGFGPIDSENILSKIPKRFLQPSQVKGIDTEAFLRRQQMANNIHDHTVLGYRGLVGNPDIPPSTIVAKIMERFELNVRNRSVSDNNINRPQSAPPNSLDTFKS